MAAEALQIDALWSGLNNPTNGKSYSGAIVATFAADGTTPKAVWENKEKDAPTTAGKSQFTLDSNGQAEVFGDGVYVIKVYAPSDTGLSSPLMTADGFQYIVSVDPSNEGYDSIDDMRDGTGGAFDGYVKTLLGYYEPGDGGGGDFYWDENSVLADNNGTIIKVTSITTGRWIRLIDDKTITHHMFGAKSDGVTSDLTSIEEASVVAVDLGYTFLIPRTDDASIIDDTCNILLGGGTDYRQEGKITYTGAHDRDALVIGEASSQKIQSKKIHGIYVESSSQSDWTDDDYVGVKLYNVDTCNVTIEKINRFTVAIEWVGYGTGANYNHVVLGLLNNNKYGLRIHPELNVAAEGSVNETVWINGRFTNTSTLHTTLDRYGVWMDGTDVPGNIINNHYFIKPAFELYEGTGEAVPFILQNVKENKGVACRSERNSVTQVRILDEPLNANNGFANTFEFVGLADSVLDYADNIYLDDQSEYGENTLYSREFDFYENKATQTYESGYIPGHTVEYDGAGSYYIAGCATIGSTGAPRIDSDGVGTLNADYFENESTARGMFATRISVRDVKNLIIKWKTVTDYPGRLVILGFDSAMAAVDPQVTPFMTGGRSMNAGSDYGGSYKNGNDDARPVFLTFNDEVDWVGVCWEAGTATCRMQGFTIQTNSLYPLVVDTFPGLYRSEKGVFLSTVAPTSGAAPYERGMFTRKDVTSSGDPIGWFLDSTTWIPGPAIP